MERTQTVTSRDGRTLSFCEWGDPTGRPLLYLHGSPGSRYLREASTDFAGLGIRLITYDRPGYGGSDRRPGRSVVDAADDVLDIADRLSVEQFGITGTSAGGPHALAVAAVAPERVTRCATALGIGPADADDLHFFAGMNDSEVAEWRVLTAPDPDPGPLLDGTRAWIESVRSDLDLPDRLRDMLVETFTEALRQGADGILDDYRALYRPGGFELSAVTCPTMLLVAEEDTVVPLAHGQWLAERLPGPGLKRVGGGHIASRPTEMQELLVWASERP